jgi:hypothetical protein
VRRSLKEDKRLIAERRGEMELKFAKWEVSYATNGNGFPARGRSATDGRCLGLQNGKQGESKNLAEANAAARVESAGSS